MKTRVLFAPALVLTLLVLLPSIASAQTSTYRFGVGGSVGIVKPSESALDTAVGFGPIIRVRPREGWSPSLGFSWLRLDDDVNEYRIRPIMAGVAYNVHRDRVWISPSLVAGYSFNDIKVPVGDTQGLELDDSFAFRPGVSFWFDATDRIGLNTFFGYLITRPDLKIEGVPGSPTVEFKADSFIWTAGLAVWVF